MGSRPVASLSDLEDMIASAGFPVRTATLEQAWDLVVDAPTSRRYQEGARRALGNKSSEPASEVVILVTLRARPGQEETLDAAAREFVASTRQLPGSIESVLYRSIGDRQTFTLLERFTGQDAFERHMASDYFHRFQVIQAPLLAEPAQAIFLDRLAP